MDNKIIIQIVNSTFGRNGSIGYRTLMIKRKLDSEKIENFVFARDNATNQDNVIKVMPFGEIFPRLLNGFRILIYNGFNHRFFEKRLFEYYTLKELKKFFKRHSHPNKDIIVHLWDSCPKIINFFRKLNIEVLIDIPISPSHETVRLQNEGVMMDTPISKIDKDEKFMFDCCKNFIVPSKYVKDVLVRNNVDSNKIHVIPFGFDIKRKYNYDRNTTENVKFLFVGNLSLRKGVNTLIEAWQDKCFESDKLILCGRETKKVKKIINKYNNKNIIRTGHVDVSQYLSSADIFVFPTNMEGSAKAIYEAMGNGLPVITTKNAGSIITNNKDGLIIPNNDSTELKTAMISLKTDLHKRLSVSRNAYRTIQHYTWDIYAEKVIEKYLRVHNTF